MPRKRDHYWKKWEMTVKQKTGEALQPKIFISYSWSTLEHEQWVIDLATRLTEQGVIVILDKWDLREGHDAYAFMEKMVTDPSVTKVVMVSDQVYARKADGRAGGVGTETQIISREIYEKEDQGKFVAVVPEKGPDGKPFLPTYYKSRIYIDFSDASRYAESFDQLLRWAYNKPLHVRPELGKPPAFLNNENHVRLGTEASFTRCLDAIKTAKPFASGATDEYLAEFTTNLERFRVEPKVGTELDDLIVQSIEEFLPYRDQLVQLVRIIAQYAPTMEYAEKLHRFFERLIPYMDRPEHLMQWNEGQFDNFKFIAHELLLYVLAVLIDNERFDLANHLLTSSYYIPGRSDAGKNAIVGFNYFRQHAKTLEFRNQRLNTRRYSLRADMLNERAKSSGVAFSSIMQADFIAFLRSRRTDDGWFQWWPETLVYSLHSYGPFEKFARSSSQNYFDKFKVLISAQNAAEFKEFCDSLVGQERLPRWQFDRIDIITLSGVKEIGSRP